MTDGNNPTPEESHANKVLIAVLVVAVILVAGLIWLGRSYGPDEPGSEEGTDGAAPRRELTDEERAAILSHLADEAPARELSDDERQELIDQLGPEPNRSLTDEEREAIMRALE